MLTKTQKQHFEVFGFLILRQLFTADEIELICCESDSILTANREGKPFPGTQRQAMIPFFEKSPALLKFIADDRIHGIAEDLMGPDYIYTGSEGNLHVGDTQWHGKDPDVAVLPEVKIAFYLEPTTRDKGALRFIPGSHRSGFSKRLYPLQKLYDTPEAMPFGLQGDEIPCVVFESQPGDVGIFAEHTWHATFGGAPGRSQHAINFRANPKTEKQLACLLESCERHPFAFHPPEELIKSDNSRLQRMISRLLELGIGPPEPTPIFEC